MKVYYFINNKGTFNFTKMKWNKIYWYNTTDLNQTKILPNRNIVYYIISDIQCLFQFCNPYQLSMYCLKKYMFPSQHPGELFFIVTQQQPRLSTFEEVLKKNIRPKNIYVAHTKPSFFDRKTVMGLCSKIRQPSVVKNSYFLRLTILTRKTVL